MRLIYLMILLGIVVGCSTVSDVPLPKMTPYDGNRQARAAYLEGYCQGYHYTVQGGDSPSPDVFSTNVVAQARMFGWEDGKMAACDILRQQEAKQRASLEDHLK